MFLSFPIDMQQYNMERVMTAPTKNGRTAFFPLRYAYLLMMTASV